MGPENRETSAAMRRDLRAGNEEGGLHPPSYPCPDFDRQLLTPPSLLNRTPTPTRAFTCLCLLVRGSQWVRVGQASPQSPAPASAPEDRAADICEQESGQVTDDTAPTLWTEPDP